MAKRKPMTPDRHRDLAARYQGQVDKLQKKMDRAKHLADQHKYKADHTRSKNK